MIVRRKRIKSTRRQARKASFFIVLAVALVCVVSIFKISDLNSKSKELAATEENYMQLISLANAEHEKLENQRQYMQTKKYIEDVAKDKLGLVYPDEIVIKPAE